MRTWHTFPLRILQGSWGIAIDLRARAMVSAEVRLDLPMAGERVLLDVSRVQLPTVDIDQLLLGLTSMAAAVQEKEPNGYVIIEVSEVTYTPTDYQPEGMAAAMIGWVSEEFGLESPIQSVHFDKVHNKYVFSM
jgi:hypothetical protein